MADNILVATVAEVKRGNISFEGLLFENGSFGISIPQTNQLISFSTSNNTASRDLKRLLGNRFSPSKVKIKGLRQLINALSIEQFEHLLFELTLLKNPQAVELSRELIGLSLTQLFSDAFNIKFEKQERQDYLIARQRGKVVRRKLTDVIKQWCEENNKPEKTRPYCIYCSDELNLMVFGKKAQELRIERNVKTNDLLRDTYTPDELIAVEKVEDKMFEYILLDKMKPTDAIKLIRDRQNRLVA